MTTPTTAYILEEWGMPLGPEQWWADQPVVKTSAHLTAGWHAFSSLLEVVRPGEVDSAFEYFGGLGAQSLMIQELFAPRRHVVCDTSPAAVEHLKSVLPPAVWASQQDAFHEDLVVPEADLVALDSGDMTARHLRRGSRHDLLLDKVASNHPLAVVVSDWAGPELERYRARYESILGRGSCDTYANYLRSLGDWLGREYGYGLHRAYFSPWSAVLALVPTYRMSAPGLVTPVPPRPMGLELG